MNVSLCVIVHDRPREVVDAVDSARSQGFTEILVLDMASSPPVPPLSGCAWQRLEQNEGVAVGRNRLARAATGDVVCFLDDDAVFTSSDVVAEIRRAFECRRVVGVALNIRRATGDAHSSELPFRGKKAPASGDAAVRPCAYFVGAGFALRRDAMLAVGGFDEDFFYSTEEIDLSMKLLATGGELRFLPSVHVEHRPSASGRGVSPQVPAMRLKNRRRYARRHLRQPAAGVHVAVWTARTFTEIRSMEGLRAWLRVLASPMRTPVERRPLPWSSLRLVHDIGGRVWW